MGTTLSNRPDSDSQPNSPSVSLVKSAQVKSVQSVRCPTCGSFAERSLLRDTTASNGEYSIQTACPACDYLMVITSLTGRVLEAYAPGQMSA